MSVDFDDPRSVRLECLQMANSQGGNVIQTARQYADFILGTKDAEIVRAARELTEKVKNCG